MSPPALEEAAAVDTILSRAARRWSGRLPRVEWGELTYTRVQALMAHIQNSWTVVQVPSYIQNSRTVVQVPSLTFDRADATRPVLGDEKENSGISEKARTSRIFWLKACLVKVD